MKLLIIVFGYFLITSNIFVIFNLFREWKIGRQNSTDYLLVDICIHTIAIGVYCTVSW